MMEFPIETVGYLGDLLKVLGTAIVLLALWMAARD